MDEDTYTPRVLAIASHVVSGYVGNSITTFVLQLLGLETSALNTVEFSNHAGYRQLKGFRTSAAQISELFEGLKMNNLDGFDMLLTGYVPGADEAEAVGRIAKEVKARRNCFWLLDPVMGDQGRLYVNEGVVPVYRSLVPNADLIVPNQFEAELLSGVPVDSLQSLSKAVDELHRLFDIAHVVITSVTFSNGDYKMMCAGSSRTSDGKSRKFMVNVPIIDGFYSGTGDLFAALTLSTLRKESAAMGLVDVQSWLPPDHIPALELPLTRSIEKVLGSMHLVIEKTRQRRDVLAQKEPEETTLDPKEAHIRNTRRSELRLIQSQQALLAPTVKYTAEELP